MTRPASYLTGAGELSPPLNRLSSVLGVITHYRCEPWLAQAVESLVNQSRPLDAIVVVDDASEHPPIEIVRQFPQVTLLAATTNSGPFHLIQTVIEQTQYDAYLQQDADDWSTPDRLAVLLEEAERTGAELVGSESLDISSDGQEIRRLRRHPLDANTAYQRRPDGWFLTWGTSLVTRALLMRIGGLSTGLSVVADGDFVRRAHHAARIANVARCCYYRRRRRDAMTASRVTGHGSPIRRAQRALSSARAIENAEAVAAGREPDLSPLGVAPAIELRHVLGPPLRACASQPAW